MCELFGFSAKKPESITEYLRTFYSHSPANPHGWGLALWQNAASEFLKEPIEALRSGFLAGRLAQGVTADVALGHIRRATVGNVYQKNCHPYISTDISGRAWTLIHNGTIFDFPAMAPFYGSLGSDTDSACLLAYFLDQMNRSIQKVGRALNPRERFSLMNRLIIQAAPGNKLNLILFDGELLYVHTNYRNTLYQKPVASGILFSTQPLDQEHWTPVPVNRLLAYKRGNCCSVGTDHGQEYIPDPEQLKMMDLACAGL